MKMQEERKCAAATNIKYKIIIINKLTTFLFND